MQTKHTVYIVSGKVRRFIASFDTEIQADNFIKKQKTELVMRRFIQYIDEYGMTVYEQQRG